MLTSASAEAWRQNNPYIVGIFCGIYSSQRSEKIKKKILDGECKTEITNSKHTFYLKIFESTKWVHIAGVRTPYHPSDEQAVGSSDCFIHNRTRQLSDSDETPHAWDQLPTQRCTLLIKHKHKREWNNFKPLTIHCQMWENDVLIYATGSEEQCKRKENHPGKCLGYTLAYWIRAPGKSAN